MHAASVVYSAYLSRIGWTETGTACSGAGPGVMLVPAAQPMPLGSVYCRQAQSSLSLSLSLDPFYMYILVNLKGRGGANVEGEKPLYVAWMFRRAVGNINCTRARNVREVTA